MRSEPIDSFETPDGHVLTLVRRGSGFVVELDHQELMGTLSTGSEVALAEHGCGELGAVENPRVLVGGLGLGFTVRAALQRLPPGSELVVAEIFPQVVQWNRTHLRELYGSTLDDDRLEIVVSDVWDRVGQEEWHSILLDTDNGPEAFSLSRNNRLYGNVGLERLRSGLVPGGLLAVWSAEPDPSFTECLSIAGFEPRCQIVEPGDNARYAIFLGRKPSGG